jgi:hypothetical protein
MRNVLTHVTVPKMLGVMPVIIEAFAHVYQIIEVIHTLQAVNQFLSQSLRSKIVEKMKIAQH